MTAVILIAAGVCIALLVAWVVIAERLDPPPAGPDDVPAGPGTRIRQTSEAAASAPARGTGQFPMLPPDPEPDPTLMQPADVRYLGKTSGEYVDDLFAKHAGAES